MFRDGDEGMGVWVESIVVMACSLCGRAREEGWLLEMSRAEESRWGNLRCTEARRERDELAVAASVVVSIPKSVSVMTWVKGHRGFRPIINGEKCFADSLCVRSLSPAQYSRP